MASASRGGPALAISSIGTRSRISSSGPSRSTRPSTSAATVLVLGPTPRISPTISGSWITLRNPAAPAGRAPGGRSASSSTRCSTPTVSGLPHSGQRPPRRGSRPAPADAAGAVPVEVVLALLGEELDRAGEPVAGLQRPPDGAVVEVGVEHRGLPAQRRRRVRVGVGDQPVAVQRRHPPVHRRVGGQAGLHREDVLGQVGVAVRDRVEARLRAQRREPRRPDVRRHQVAALAGLQGDLQQVARVQPEDRPAVRAEVADPPERRGEPRGRGRGRAGRSGGAPCGSGRPACRSWRSPPRA